jgi:hypothetical protein
MKHVVISLLNFNSKKDTLECLHSLKDIDKKNIKLTVVVVDNASKEEFNIENGEIEGLPLVVIKESKNLGFSGGNNVVINYALRNEADYVLALNSDTYVDKNFLEELLKTIEKDNLIGIVAPKIYFAPGYEFHKEKYSQKEKGKVFWYAGGKIDWANVTGYHRGVDEVDHQQYEKVEETEIATGCCMLIRKEVFRKVGLFEDKYFLYYEDSDLCMRVKRKGFKILYVPSSIIWHKNAGSAGGSGSQLQDYYITRNRLLFGSKFAPIRSKIALFKESLRLLFSGRRWQKQGVVDFYLGRLGKGNYSV